MRMTYPTKRRYLPWLFFLPTVFLLLFSPVLNAVEQTIETVTEGLENIEKRLESGTLSREDLSIWNKAVNGAEEIASACITRGEEELKSLEENIANLGNTVQDEPPDVARKRKEFKKQKDDLEKRLAQCRVIKIRSDELKDTITRKGKAILAKELLARGPNTMVLLIEQLKSPTNWIAGFNEFVTSQSGLELFGPAQWALVAIAVLVALGVGRALANRLKVLSGAQHWQDEFSEKFMLALVTTGAHYAKQLLAVLAAAGTVYLVTRSTDSTPFVALLAYGLAIYFISVATIRLLLYPVPPAEQYLPLTPDIARGMAQRLTVLALMFLIGYLAFYTDFSRSLPLSSLMLARDIFSLIVVLNLVWALWLLRRSPRFADVRWVILAVAVLLGISVVAEWLGYRNLALAGRRAVIGTLVVLGAALLVSELFRGLFKALDEGEYGWARRFRELTGTRSGEPVAGLIWIRLITTVLIWSGSLMAVFYIWEISDEVAATIRNYLINGFNIGSLHIIPVRVLWAGITLALLLTFGAWIRSRLEHRWLVLTRMERGAREAMVTITGYVLLTIAVLVSLAVAGLDFSNLAIIAGALSVGIGFGLQNVVNNFVSGLILLFERPVKKGDWIQVGGTEGYVKQIRIRSTQIETFDRSDVIVPNSELISGQVTNWMLKNTRGRAKIAVGVAYGTDTEKVRDILLQLAQEHPRVIKDGSSPKPRVLFLGFGDSSLDFELRVFVYNIDERLGITSDLNFAIDKAFREAGIEIPFPQRDVHVRDWPAATAPESREEYPTSAEDRSPARPDRHPGRSDSDADED